MSVPRRKWICLGDYYEDPIGFKIDTSDFHLVDGASTSTSVGAKNSTRLYLRIKVDNRHVFLHRVIMSAKKGQLVDHINRDTKDNRRKNLRIVSISESLLNRGKMRNHVSSKFHGVSYVTMKKRVGRRTYAYNYWQTAVTVNGVRTFTKNHKTELDAAACYDEIAPLYHGSFAKRNLSYLK